MSITSVGCFPSALKSKGLVFIIPNDLVRKSHILIHISLRMISSLKSAERRKKKSPGLECNPVKPSAFFDQNRIAAAGIAVEGQWIAGF